jgi:hypothetical protein
MPSRLEIYRERAEACRRTAASVSAGDRDRWLEVAEQWTKMAEFVERELELAEQWTRMARELESISTAQAAATIGQQQQQAQPKKGEDS